MSKMLRCAIVLLSLLMAAPSMFADTYVKREVRYVTCARGGEGAFREFVEKLLADNGVLEQTVASFL